VCQWVNEWVSESVIQTSWMLYMSQSSTDLHQTYHQGTVPGDVITYCFWWKSGISMFAKPVMELIFTIVPMKNSFNVKYLENGTRYDVGLKGGQVGNQPWAFDWHYELWPRMTLNHHSSRSLKLDIKYTVGPKKLHRFIFAITFSNIDRFR